MEMVSRECPLCGSTDDSYEFAVGRFDPAEWGRFAFASRKLPEYMRYRLVLCPDCGLLYANPVPVLETLTAAYESADFDSAVEAGYAARTYARLLRNILRRLPDRAGALDIGTGDGAFLRELLDLGFSEVVGVEPSKAPIAAAEDAVRPLIRHGLFRSDDFRGRKFRLITCFQTLEHVYQPLQLCQDAFGLLKDGGVFLCVAHNRLAWSARLLGLRSPIYDIEHLQLFSRRSAGRLLERAGFHGVRTEVVFNRYPASYWLRLAPLPKRSKTAIIAAIRSSVLGRMPIVLPAGNLAVFGLR